MSEAVAQAAAILYAPNPPDLAGVAALEAVIRRACAETGEVAEVLSDWTACTFPHERPNRLRLTGFKVRFAKPFGLPGFERLSVPFSPIASVVRVAYVTIAATDEGDPHVASLSFVTEVSPEIHDYISGGVF